MRCSHCRQDLPLTMFPPSAAVKREYRCLACHRAKNKAQRDANATATRKAARERQRKRRATNSDKPRSLTSAQQEQNRERSIRYAKENRQKKNAQNRVYRAIKAGLLVRCPCEVCAAKTAHAHHDDYSKPLDVRWLCPTHHNREHRWIG